jgi:hypothetical protein
MLFCAFGAVATLDELARIPFYNTLPVIAILMNSASLLLFFRKRGRIEFANRIFARLASIFEMLLKRPAFVFGSSRQQQNSLRHSDIEKNKDTWREPSLKEIEAALRKVHSVAWGFPTYNPLTNPINQEEQVNDETHQ